MKVVLRTIDNNGTTYSALMFCCPGCVEMYGGDGLHIVPVNTVVTSPSWDWDGNFDHPTLSPSILTGRNDPSSRCHSFLRNGEFQFLNDNTHSLRGKTVEMPDLPDWVSAEIDKEGDE